MATNYISALVDALPELYQPIFGHPEHSAGASRPCADRLQAIGPIVAALEARLGRPVRVLDLGCAQGFFSLSLAAAGAHVVGVDRQPANVALCLALAEEHPALRVSFLQADAEEVLRTLPEREYDLVLALSIVHHLCHERGADATADLLRGAAGKIGVLVAEAALNTEPVYWARAQPSDVRVLFAGFAFLRVVAHHPTHLSGVPRPLFFASSQWWWLGGDLARIEHWTSEPHEMAANIHLGTRRYYFSAGRLAKVFLFEGAASERNRAELKGEIDFLVSPPPGLARLPALLAHELTDEHGWLVRDLLPGRRLSALIDAGAAFDRLRAVEDVLDDLCALEAAGLYHGDVRVWNVILCEDGKSALIDYGDIGPRPVDIAWPENVFLSFIVFVHELQGTALPRVFPARTVSFTPSDFAEPVRSWIRRLWRAPLEQWTFAHIRSELKAAIADNQAPGLPSNRPVIAAADAEAQVAIDRYLDAMALEQRHLVAALERELSTQRQREQVLHTLAGDLATARGENRSLQHGLEAERGAHADAQRLAGDLRARLAEAVAEIAARDVAIEDARVAHASLQSHMAATVAEFELQIESWQAERVRSEASTEALVCQLETHSRQLEALTRQLEGVAAEKAWAQAQAADLAGQVAKAAARLEQQASATTSLRSERDALQRDVAAEKETAHHWWKVSVQLQEQLATLMRSRSWRLTAPIRGAKRIVTGDFATVRAAIRSGMTSLRGTPRPAPPGTRDVTSSGPTISERVGSVTRRFPYLHRRLAKLARSAGLLQDTGVPGQARVQGGDTLQPDRLQDGGEVDSNLSANARRVLSDLRAAVVRNRRSGE